MTVANLPAYVPPVNAPPPVKKQSFMRRHWAILTVGVAGLLIGGVIGGAGAPGSSAPEPITEPTSQTSPAPVRTVEVETVVESGAPEVCIEVAEDLFEMTSGFNSDIALNYNEALGIVVDELSSGYPDASELDRATGLVNHATDTVAGFSDQLEDGLSAKYAECVG